MLLRLRVLPYVSGAAVYRASARVTDHSGEIANDENCLVSKVLKLSQFVQNNRMAEVDI